MEQAAPAAPDLLLRHEQRPPGCQSLPGPLQQAIGEQDFTPAPLSGSFGPDSPLLHFSSLDSCDAAQVSGVSNLPHRTLIHLWQIAMFRNPLHLFPGCYCVT